MRIPASVVDVVTPERQDVEPGDTPRADEPLCAGIRIIYTGNSKMLIARFDIDDGLNTIFQGFPEYMELLVRIIDTGCRSLGIPFKIEGRQLITDKWDENYGRKVS